MIRKVLVAALLPAFSVQAADQAANGGFDDGQDGWWATQNLAPELRDGQLCAVVPAGLTNPWDAIIGQDNVALEKGESYEFSFRASGDPKGPVRALVQENKAPWTAYIETVPQTAPAGETYTAQFRALVDNPEAQIVFQIGGSAAGSTICLDDVHLTGGAEIQAYRPDTGPTLRVNQVGYLPDGPKRATWVSDQRTPQGWTFRNAAGKVLVRGKTVVLGDDPASGLPLHLIDFSEVSETGEGFMLGAGGDRSYPFAIRGRSLSGPCHDALGYFYPVRSGIAIDGALAGAAYARPAGHVGVAPNLGDTEVPCQTPNRRRRPMASPGPATIGST